jgi:hypothetical protein
MGLGLFFLTVSPRSPKTEGCLAHSLLENSSAHFGSRFAAAGGDAAVGAATGRGGRAPRRVGGGIYEGYPQHARGGAGASEAAAARPGARRVLRADTGVAGMARLGLPPHGAHRRCRGPLHQDPHDGRGRHHTLSLAILSGLSLS